MAQGECPTWRRECPVWNWAVAFTLVGMGTVFGGCSANGPERVAVHGSVVLDAEPLSQGSITFIPEGEGTAASGEILDGQYEIPRERGPSPGRCRVEVPSYQETGEMVPGTAEGGMVAEVAQVIPAAYNMQSNLEVELQPGIVNECDFELSSSP